MPEPQQQLEEYLSVTIPATPDRVRKWLTALQNWQGENGKKVRMIVDCPVCPASLPGCGDKIEPCFPQYLTRIIPLIP